MTENKRFVKAYCCGDTGLVDNEKEEWFVENINSISDLKRNWNDVLDKLNEVADENEQLKIERNYLQSELHNCSVNSRQRTLEEIKKEIEKLERYE